MFVTLRTTLCEDTGRVVAETTTKFTEDASTNQAPVEPALPILTIRDKIIEAFKAHGRLTPNECRKFVHPERSVGKKAFGVEFASLVTEGVLKPCSRTQRALIFQLAR